MQSGDKVRACVGHIFQSSSLKQDHIRQAAGVEDRAINNSGRQAGCS
jgi:hypothetical protein